ESEALTKESAQPLLMSRRCGPASPALPFYPQKINSCFRGNRHHIHNIYAFNTPYPPISGIFLIDFQNSLCYTQAHSARFPFKADPQHLSQKEPSVRQPHQGGRSWLSAAL